MTTLGLIFPPDQPPERLREVATAADRQGIEELWLWEDCFKEGGIAAAAAVLAWTDRISVGLGLLPVPLRNVALTAMELATLARLFPGRLLPGVGHGVLDWMAQTGSAVESPMTLLREYTTALRALLAGETVTTSGRYVQLDGVALDWPPETVPPLLLGGMRPRTTALAGELGDGLIVSPGEGSLPLGDAVEVAGRARADAGRQGPFEVVTFLPVRADLPPAEIAAAVDRQAAAGAGHVALLATDPTGAPQAGPALVDFVPVVSRLRSRLAAGGRSHTG